MSEEDDFLGKTVTGGGHDAEEVLQLYNAKNSEDEPPIACPPETSFPLGCEVYVPEEKLQEPIAAEAAATLRDWSCTGLHAHVLRHSGSLTFIKYECVSFVTVCVSIHRSCLLLANSSHSSMQNNEANEQILHVEPHERIPPKANEVVPNEVVPKLATPKVCDVPPGPLKPTDVPKQAVDRKTLNRAGNKAFTGRSLCRSNSIVLGMFGP